MRLEDRIKTKGLWRLYAEQFRPIYRISDREQNSPIARLLDFTASQRVGNEQYRRGTATFIESRQEICNDLRGDNWARRIMNKDDICAAIRCDLLKTIKDRFSSCGATEHERHFPNGVIQKVGLIFTDDEENSVNIGATLERLKTERNQRSSAK